MKSMKYAIDEHWGKGHGIVLDEYSCVLNQTDLKSNKNKFYIMQVIKKDSEYIHYIRYGRIGEVGSKTYKPYTSESSAIASFKSQFRSKTGNTWGQDFCRKAGKYFMSHVSYEEELKDVSEEDIKIPESKLNKKVQTLLSLISDIEMMKKTLIQLDVDTKKLPLGKIHADQLKKAGYMLDELMKEVQKKKPDNDKILEITSGYFTMIPYSCGRKKPPVLDSNEMIAKFRDVLDDLKNIVVAVKMINNKSDVNPIDNVYNEINTDIKPLAKNTKIWKYISNYVSNTHGKTHGFKLSLCDIYDISRKNDKPNFEKLRDEYGNVELLIHGSRLCNWCSILKNDLLLDPSRIGAYITGKMFGYGVYFANSFSKSAQYCGVPYGGKGKICLALAEVALGKELKLKSADCYMTGAKLKTKGCNSTWGLGNATPSSYVEYKGVSIPQGQLTDSKQNSVLRYDEKIVYDSDQFRIRYLVVCDMDWS